MFGRKVVSKLARCSEFAALFRELPVVTSRYKSRTDAPVNESKEELTLLIPDEVLAYKFHMSKQSSPGYLNGSNRI